MVRSTLRSCGARFFVFRNSTLPDCNFGVNFDGGDSDDNGDGDSNDNNDDGRNVNASDEGDRNNDGGKRCRDLWLDGAIYLLVAFSIWYGWILCSSI